MIFYLLPQQTIDLNRSTTAYFFGAGHDKIDPADKLTLDRIQDRLQDLINRQVEDGYTNFIVEIKEGLDLIFAATALSLLKDYRYFNRLSLIPIIPFSMKKFSPPWREIRTKILKARIPVFCLSKNDYPRLEQVARQFMLQHSSRLLGQLSDSSPETLQLIEQGRRNNLSIVDIGRL